MLYIISGASRSGKTILAKKLAAKERIPYLSLDWIMMGFTNGIPEYGVHDKLFPDEIAQRLWAFLSAMFESMIAVETDCVIEGEAILPELIIELIEKFPGELTVCFIGYTEVDIDKKYQEIRRYSSHQNDWLADQSEAYVRDHIQNMIVHSRKIKKGCEKHGLRYFDASADLMDTLEIAINYLVKPI